MYISDLTHFLDESGNIAKEMQKEDKELASFLALIVDAATKYSPNTKIPGIRCAMKKRFVKINVPRQHYGFSITFQ